MDKIAGASVVYIDTNIFVYFVEAAPDFFEKVKELFEHVAAAGARLVTSEITLAECIYRPSQENDAALVSVYEMLFEQSGEVDLVCVDFDKPTKRGPMTVAPPITSVMVVAIEAEWMAGIIKTFAGPLKRQNG